MPARCNLPPSHATTQPISGQTGAVQRPAFLPLPLQHLVEFFSAYDGRLNGTAKHLKEAWEAGKRFPEAAADDSQAHAIVKVGSEPWAAWPAAVLSFRLPPFWCPLQSITQRVFFSHRSGFLLPPEPAALACAPQVPVLVARYGGTAQLASRVEAAVRAQQNSEAAVAQGQAAAAILERVVVHVRWAVAGWLRMTGAED